MSLVIFDFDKTLTTRDALRPFAVFAARSTRRRKNLVLFCAAFCLFKLGFMDNRGLKETFLKFFLKGIKEQQGEEIAAAFFRSHLKRLQRTDVVDRLYEHLRAEDEVYIASANFRFLLQPLKHLWGLSGIIATNAEIKEGRFTGSISGPVCRGADKVAMVSAALGCERVRACICYADGEDAELLSAVGNGIRVE